MLNFKKQQKKKLQAMYNFNQVNQMIIFVLTVLPIIQIFRNRSVIVLWSEKKMTSYLKTIHTKGHCVLVSQLTSHPYAHQLTFVLHKNSTYVESENMHVET